MNNENLNKIESKYLRSDKVCAFLNISKTTLWRLVREDPTFPKSIHLINKVRVWEAKDLFAWLEAKKAERA